MNSRILLEELGIFHLRSVAYTPEQNGRIEREMRTIVEAVRAEIYAEELSTKFWAEALNYSVFTINQTGTSSVEGKSPADLWFGRHVNLKSMKPFGCECYVLLPKHERKKLDKRSIKGILIGYDIEEQGYRVYIPEKNKIEVSCDVLFKENIPINDNNTTEISLDTCYENKKEYSVERQQETIEESEDETDDFLSLEDEEGSAERENVEELPEQNSQNKDVSHVETSSTNLRNRRQIKPHPKYNDYYTNYLALTADSEDISTEEALQNVAWKRAMEDEMESLKKMNTWILTDLPEGRKPLTCKWILRTKGDGRMKARLVARGYDQEYGVDYFNTFAPVVRHPSITQSCS